MSTLSGNKIIFNVKEIIYTDREIANNTSLNTMKKLNIAKKYAHISIVCYKMYLCYLLVRR